MHLMLKYILIYTMGMQISRYYSILTLFSFIFHFLVYCILIILLLKILNDTKLTFRNTRVKQSTRTLLFVLGFASRLS